MSERERLALEAYVQSLKTVSVDTLQRLLTYRHIGPDLSPDRRAAVEYELIRRGAAIPEQSSL